MNDVMNVVYLDSPTTHTSSSIPLRTLRVCMCVCVFLVCIYQYLCTSLSPLACVYLQFVATCMWCNFLESRSD